MRRRLASLVRRLVDRIAPIPESPPPPAPDSGALEALARAEALLGARLGYLHGGLAHVAAEVARLAGPRDPRAVCFARGQVYSQNEEDGIIAEILGRIGVESRVFVEIGVGSGVENNTRLLLETGWSGLWLEGDETHVATIRTLLAPHLEAGRLALAPGMVSAENVAATVDGYLAGRVPDVLSVDIDHNTSHVWRALGHLRPRLAVIEYNAHFPPQTDWEIPYDPEGIWESSTRFGASLAALQRIGEANGMRLVGCDLLGVNAFFVRADLVDETRFLPPFDARTHHRPPAFDLVRMNGHPRHAGVLGRR
ncbi:hypothetical protein [Salinarimonas ramus]|uniref:Uncharacterized protein n=1 Tax=Salinarimonas ramus TaxID=690164 RepID=A0A917V7R7_9HYPH|nr:hypothetical protein [Salinarimonas ramus]GGK47145.1 hypothetical protein GCM10011322_37750 [Salinarimonas ramus]